MTFLLSFIVAFVITMVAQQPGDGVQYENNHCD